MTEQIFPTPASDATNPSATNRGDTSPSGQTNSSTQHGGTLEANSVVPATPTDGHFDSPADSIEEPAKVMRLGAMLRQLLSEIRADPLDEMSRQRLREIYETSVQELGSAVSGGLQEELERLTLPLADDKPPTRDELRVAKAQLVGWLEGLVQGIQAAIFAQQVSAQKQLANMRTQLPPSRSPRTPPNTGTYL